MITAIDIETIPNVAMIPLLPEPKIDSRLKDPEKIAKAQSEGKAKQVEKMGLDAMTARVCCFAAVSGFGSAEQTEGDIIAEDSDESEQLIIEEIMAILGAEAMRLVTWNGIGFDLPMIYKRAIILGVNPAQFGAPPMTQWTKRYKTDFHFDLMQIWGGWSTQGWEKLENVARMVIGEVRADIPYELMPELLKTDEGRAQILEGCTNHTKLTWDLFNKFQGFLFA